LGNCLGRRKGLKKGTAYLHGGRKEAALEGKRGESITNMKRVFGEGEKKKGPKGTGLPGDGLGIFDEATNVSKRIFAAPAMAEVTKG